MYIDCILNEPQRAIVIFFYSYLCDLQRIHCELKLYKNMLKCIMVKYNKTLRSTICLSMYTHVHT